MNEIMYAIGIVIVALVGLAKSTRKTPRFERRDSVSRDGVAIHWLTVRIGKTLKVNLKHIIIAPAKVLAEAGWLIPERFLEAREGNNWGAIIEVAEEVPGDYPWTQALCTQLSLVEALFEIGEGFQRVGSALFSPESLVTTGDGDRWTFDTQPDIIISHQSTGNGNRSEYSIEAPGLPDPDQLQLLDFEDKSDENIGGAD
ncbi:MAG TPA: hypothetical protein EYN66_14425 [Myxococcales bacterium]|nr:hypothetical protein [Myxococcales bacterium]